MPRGDGTGPTGQGPGTGRGTGVGRGGGRQGQGGGRGGGGQGQGGGRGGGFAMGLGGNCTCPNCKATVAHQRGAPCYQMKCPQCGQAMTRQR